MTDDERWYIVGADLVVRYMEVFAGDMWEFIITTRAVGYFYRSRDLAEAAFAMRASPSTRDRIVDGATFDAIRAMALADEEVTP